MKYISTRKDNHEYSFTEAFLNSYTDDEGLFCPKDVPVISKETMLKWSVWKVILHNWIEVKFLWSFSGYLIHIYWRRWCTHRRIGNDSENVVWKLSSTWVGYCTWIHTLFTVDEVSRSYELCGGVLWSHLSCEGLFNAVYRPVPQIPRAKGWRTRSRSVFPLVWSSFMSMPFWLDLIVIPEPQHLQELVL